MKKFLLIMMLAAAATAAHSQSGVIRELTGEVELKHAGSSAFVPARSGDAVAQNTLVSTGLRSTAVIAVGNTVITVRPLTRLTLEEIQRTSGAENLNINLETGRIRVDVTPVAGTRSTTTVQSPTATASVRGTSFEVDAMNLTVIEGTVIYQGSSGMAVPVTAGSASIIDSDGIPVNPVVIAESELTPASPFDLSLTGEMAPSDTESFGLDVGIGWREYN